MNIYRIVKFMQTMHDILNTNMNIYSCGYCKAEISSFLLMNHSGKLVYCHLISSSN